jgi:SAM-dependent methyltransferase
MRRDLHEENRLSWNAATRAHNSHKRDQAKFLRDGGTTLFPDEIALLGDIRGQRVAHLQCNAGQDTLGLAQLGADVVGVDISDEAIAFARTLAADAGIAARFERADVYDWLDATRRSAERFDVVFASYGAVGWLSDLDAWTHGIAGVLAPGGRFVLLEFHPIAMMFDERGQPAYSYFSHGAPFCDGTGVSDYVGQSGAALAPSGFEEGVKEFHNPHRSHGFYFSLGELVSAVAKSGLVIERLVEYPYSNGCRLFPGMTALDGNRFALPKEAGDLPLMVGWVARKPAG